MFREHARLFTILQFAADLGLSVLAFVLAYASRIHLAWVLPDALDRMLNPELLRPAAYLWMVVPAIGWWAVAAFSLGLYRISFRRSDWEKIRIILESAVLLGLFLGFLSFALKLEISRTLIALFVFYQAALLVLARVVLGIRIRRRDHPAEGRNIVIVGAGRKASEMGRLISRYSDWGLRILGFVETVPAEGGETGLRVLGGLADLPRIVEENVVDEMIFVAGDPADLSSLDSMLAVCRERGIRTRVALDLFHVKISGASMEFLESVPLLTFSTTPDHAASLLVKRIMDVGIALVLLVLLSPLMLLTGLLVRLTSRGPAIYRQVRCGLYGRRFVLYKFRSMREGAEDVLWEIKHLNEMDGPVFKMRNDPRVTPLGRFLRKSSIDELPQFWNVLKGDMSLVGPRAPLPEEVREYTPWQRRRLSVKPGITCLWQVSGRNEIDFQEWMKLDLQYIDNWSLALDLKILLLTFPTVLLGKGAR